MSIVNMGAWYSWIDELIASERRKIRAGAKTANSVWPNGCRDPESCARHKDCMYMQCQHDGKVIAPDVDAQQDRGGK